jgi:hypothetical protein
LTLQPTDEPRPALKYRLLPGFMEQVPGNAAVPYGKVTAEEFTFFGKQEWGEKVDRWREMPLSDLRRETINLPDSSIFFLEQGARSKYCDWQLPFHQVPFYRILLPDAQQSRSYARLLAVKARHEIAQGKFDDAVTTFQTNFALGRNVAEGETLINGLIGIAICNVMFPQITDFVQQPGSPNLYWALTALPSPLIDMRKALEVESNGVELSFPELKDVASAQFSPAKWRDMFHRFATQYFELTLSLDAERPSPAALDKACETALPVAKRSLIERGMPSDNVEAMSLHQVALLYTLQSVKELFDEGAKYYTLPFPQAIQGIDAAIAQANRARDDGSEIIPAASQVLPAIWSTRTAIARTDRHIAGLRVIEAIRIYGAKHDGKLPAKLSDITEVPIPDDPVTGKPFEYRLEADVAHLQGPVFRDVHFDYEITMTPAK